MHSLIYILSHSAPHKVTLFKSTSASSATCDSCMPIQAQQLQFLRPLQLSQQWLPAVVSNCLIPNSCKPCMLIQGQQLQVSQLLQLQQLWLPAAERSAEGHLGPHRFECGWLHGLEGGSAFHEQACHGVILSVGRRSRMDPCHSSFQPL